jgi:hypothetical protein
MALAMARPWKHPKTGIFWLRKRIPADLPPLLGKREEKQSLGTRDPNEAKRVHAQALVELGERWANLRSGPRALSEREAHELVVPAYEWWVNAHRDNPSDQKIWKSEHFGELWQYHDASKYTGLPFAEQNRRMDEDGYLDLITMEAFCREKADELLIQRGLKVDALSRQKIERAFGAAIQRASLTLAKLASGQRDALLGTPASPTHSEVRSQTAIASEPLNFETLVAGWAAERRPMPKTVYEYKRVMRVLTGFLGHDDARRVSPKDLVAWKAKMIEAGLHPKTIQGAKLGPVRAILQWAVDNHLLPINSATRVTIDVKTRAGESKRGFDDAEAAIILAAARLEADPVKRWVPLLGAYSGARVSEICQLRVEEHHATVRDLVHEDHSRGRLAEDGRLRACGASSSGRRRGRFLVIRGHHDASAGQRFAKAVVEPTDFSTLGALDRLVLIGFDLRITGGTAVIAEAVPFIPPIRAAGTGMVFPKPRHRCRPHSDAGARASGISGSPSCRAANGSGSSADGDAVRDGGCDTSGGRGLRSPPARGGVTLSGFGFSGAWAAPSMVC